LLDRVARDYTGLQPQMLHQHDAINTHVAPMGSAGTPDAPFALPEFITHTCQSKLPGTQFMHDPNEGAASPPLAVQYLPEIEQRLFWINSIGNVKTAINKRILETESQVTLSDDEKSELKAVSDVLSKEIMRDRKQISRIIQDTLGLWWSKKWTQARAEKALSELLATHNPSYKFDAAIKLEPSKPGKAPRLLIADGDRGQVMAWVVMGVLERWTFQKYKARSIKGLPKVEAMQRVAQSLRQKHPRDATPGAGPCGPDVPVAIVENDGSAWDAHMSFVLRQLTENGLMETVAKMVEPYFIPAGNNEFVAARARSNTLKTLCLNVRRDKGADKTETCDLPKGKAWQVYIPAIRRSGCRGTSILNFLANMICWCWVIGGRNATKLIQPQGAKVECVDGVVRWVKMAFEGDDSILSFFAYDSRNNMTQGFLDMLDARWRKLGHEPKLFWRKPGGDSPAEFTGWHFVVNEEGLTDAAAPDLIRNLINMAYTTNAAAIAAARDGDMPGFMRSIAPGVIARLYPLASRYPTLCRTISEQFLGHIDRVMAEDLTRDEIYSLQLEPEDFGFKESAYSADPDAAIARATQRFRPILARFREELAKGNPEQEAKLAVQLGVVKTEDDYGAMVEVLAGGYRVGSASEPFRDAIREHRPGA
jgi:hypothetical protein